MAKTKLGQVKHQLQQAVATVGKAPSEPAVPPAKRRRSKGPDQQDQEMPPRSSVVSEVAAHGGLAPPRSRYPATNTPVVDAEIPVPKWENFELIKARYRLTDEETTAVLLQTVGPDPRGSGFWHEYQKRVKDELTQQKVKEERIDKSDLVEVPTAAGVRRLRPLLPDNQLGDPDILKEYNELEDATYLDVGEGEEEADDDDDDPIMEVTGGHGGDDQDSPQAGSATVPPPRPEMMVEPQPNPPVEPLKGEVVMDENAKHASDELKKQLGSRPTAGRNGRVKGARDTPPAPSPENFKSLLFPGCYVYHRLYFLVGNSNICVLCHRYVF